MKLTDFGLAGSIVEYKKKIHHTVASDISQHQLDPDLIVAMSAAARCDESTGSTDDEITSSSNTQDEPEISNQEQGEKNNLKWIRRRTVCGTAGYRPPEQVQERFLDYFSRSGYDERADWFSLGVCCFTMLTGHRPFPTKKELLQSDSQRDIAQTVKTKPDIDAKVAGMVVNDAEYRCLMFEVKFPKYFADEPHAQHFVEALLARNPEDRPRYGDIVAHPWMEGESFDADEVVKYPVPGWVKDHAFFTSTRNDQSSSLDHKQEYLSHASLRSLTECIESLCSDCFERYGAAYAENFAIKWSTLARTQTLDLFRHWNYMSDDVISLEAHTLYRNEEGKKAKKQHSSGRFGDLLRFHSSISSTSNHRKKSRS